jgi:hypothetical protein
MPGDGGGGSGGSGPPDKNNWLYLTGDDNTDLANIEAAQKSGYKIGPAVQRPSGTAILLLGNYE